jgi:hypothetical protein
MFYNVMKLDEHLKTREKCQNNEPKASDFNISRVFSNVRRVLSRCKTRLSLLYLPLRYKFISRKATKSKFKAINASPDMHPKY